MQTLHIQLVEVEEDIVELRYFFAQTSQYEPQILNLAAIQALLKQAKRDYYIGQQPDLAAIGQQLFFWLDGDGRWLSRAIANCPSEGLILAIATSAKLAHLPWEALHDGTDFLVRRVNPVVVPVRWSDRPTQTKSVQAKTLQVLFMATSPEEVEPVLDFEREEARILKDTQELPLVLRVEESGCITQLGKLWSRYRQPFDVFHLTGHASISTASPYTPYFVTETETGDHNEATAAEIWNVFRNRPPQLVFLSGCRTGQAADNGAVPSLAEALIQQGATAVLGWGRSVTDVAATAAAAYLYGELAAGCQLSEALASTYQHLLEQEVNDWHLLRLYVRGECPGALVEPLGDYNWQSPEPAYQQFLDPVTDLVRVATPQEFVGRRRILQRCLKALRSPNNLGVLLHGMGGVGKSTLAARLLERMAGYDRIFIYRQLDEAKLLRSLSAQCISEQGHEILNGKLPLMQCLTKFLQQGLNKPEQQFVFVLDDFEANLESRADGVQVLKPEAIEVLMALLKAIANSKLPHRLIITCRYNFQLPELDRRLDRQPLAALQGADLRKKCDRLTSFNAQSDIDPGLQERAKKTADGNPRLLEWLDKILQDKQLDQELILQEMEKAEQKFRENILAEELLKQQPVELRQMLGLALVYEIPVPQTAIAAVCANISNLEDHIHRATTLGLLEISNLQAEVYRVPRILEKPLEAFISQAESHYRNAAEVLHRLWWVETSTEKQWLEIHRLAILGKEEKIAVEVAVYLSSYWWQKSRFREVVKTCRDTLEIVEDYRTLHELAKSESNLGEIDKALEHYQQVLKLCPPKDERQKAATLHQLAGIYPSSVSFRNQQVVDKTFYPEE